MESLDAVDAHCHLDLPPLCETLDESLDEARAVGVTRWIIGGISPPRWATHRALSQRYKGAYWTAGYHPVYLARELGGRSTTEREEVLDALRPGLNSEGGKARGRLTQVPQAGKAHHLPRVPHYITLHYITA